MRRRMAWLLCMMLLLAACESREARDARWEQEDRRQAMEWEEAPYLHITVRDAQGNVFDQAYAKDWHYAFWAEHTLVVVMDDRSRIPINILGEKTVTAVPAPNYQGPSKVLLKGVHKEK